VTYSFKFNITYYMCFLYMKILYFSNQWRSKDLRQKKIPCASTKKLQNL